MTDNNTPAPPNGENDMTAEDSIVIALKAELFMVDENMVRRDMRLARILAEEAKVDPIPAMIAAAIAAARRR